MFNIITACALVYQRDPDASDVKFIHIACCVLFGLPILLIGGIIGVMYSVAKSAIRDNVYKENRGINVSTNEQGGYQPTGVANGLIYKFKPPRGGSSQQDR